MSLTDPFALRIAKIRTFMRIPPFRALELKRPPDLQLLVQKVLARIADDPGDRHAQIYVALEFRDYHPFFAEVVDAVSASVDAAAEDLADLGIVMPEPPELPAGKDRDPKEWARPTARYLSAVGNALPEEAGSLVLVVEPAGTGSRRRLGWSLGALARYVESDRAKIIVVDGGDGPLVPDDVEDRLVRLDFAVAPEEIEREVLSDLEGGDLAPEDARRYRLLAGAFATSARRFDEGEEHLRTTLAEAREAGEPGEEANVLYNLGNLYARTRRHEEASEALTRAASMAMKSGNNGLAAMALSNLGVSLYREGRGQEALESLGGARKLFQALGHRPGEAHVVDCTARIWSDSRPDKARALWREAADIYDSIEAPHLKEVRDAGSADIQGKLKYLDIRSESG